MTELPSEMKAARVLEQSDQLVYKIQDVPLPTIRSTELLLQVKVAGFCHTDTLVPMGVFGTLPITGSHEPAGLIVKIGDEAKKYGDWKVGDRIAAVNTARACGVCPECKYYDDRYCAKQSMIGLSGTDGAFAEYCIVDASRAAIIPQGVTFEQAAPLSCAGVTIYSAIKRANLKDGEVLGFSGIGALGSLGIQMAKAMGYKVVGIDARDQPIALANSVKFKPDLAVNAMNTPVEEAAKSVESLRPAGWDRGPGCDGALIMLNMSDTGLEYAKSMVKNHGTLIMVAGPLESKFDVRDFILRQITVFGTQNGTGKDLEETMALCLKFGIESRVRRYSLTEESMSQMVHDVEGPEWSGKAVVVI